ncbi:MAG: biopolymer transporter ExbD [Bacteroidetes bacterium GWA2_31_9]|nr:MAG: biopolymer transporter ExbD [Bacteroidetes bacterium GWA2_31_9]
MSIKTRNKVSVAFSMSSMTDLVFLLLIFFMITSTLVHPTALKLLLPQSNNQTAGKPNTTVSITPDLQYYVENNKVELENMEQILIEKIGNNQDIYISLYVDKTVPIDYVVKVMNIAKKNNYKLVLATSPN